MSHRYWMPDFEAFEYFIFGKNRRFITNRGSCRIKISEAVADSTRKCAHNLRPCKRDEALHTKIGFVFFRFTFIFTVVCGTFEMEKSSTPERIILTRNRGCGTHIIQKSGSQPRRSAKWRECYESTSAPFCRKVKEVEQKKYRAADT